MSWLLLLLIVFVVWLIFLVKDSITKQRTTFLILKGDLDELKEQVNRIASISNEIIDAKPDAEVSEEALITGIVSPPIVSPLIEVEETSNTLHDAYSFESDEPEQKEFSQSAIYKEITSTETGVLASTASATDEKMSVNIPPIQKTSFFERYPDLEKFIGENLINKIGIAILVLGIGFFVKYAIDQDWINAVGRMAIGILSGGLLIGVAHKLRINFAAFSSVLVGGGLAVLYFSIGIGFHEYALLSQPMAFIIMTVITAFAVILSLLYNRVELAVIALLGGFGTPFFISTGSGSYIILFSYLLILNVGMTILSMYKKWPLVNILSYIFTILIFGGWFLSIYNNNDAAYLGALIFATLFYLLFFAMNVGYNIKNKSAFKAFDISVLLSNSFVYLLVGLLSLKGMALPTLQGIFVLALAIFNFVFARLIYKNEGIDRNLFYLLLGIVLSLISLTAPIQLSGNYITIFWAAEAVLLLWLAQKSGIQFIKKASLGVFALMFVSLLIDWWDLYNGLNAVKLIIIFNKAFVTGLFAALALFVYRLLLQTENNNYFIQSWKMMLTSTKTFFSVVAVLMLYFVLLQEVTYQCDNIISLQEAKVVMLGVYHIMFLGVLHLFLKRFTLQWHSFLVIYAFCIIAVGWLLSVNNAAIDIRNQILHNGINLGWLFYTYLAAAVVLLYMLQQVWKQGKQLAEQEKSSMALVYWPSAFLLVYVLSLMLDHIIVWTAYESPFQEINLISQSHKFGYAILWGVTSFILMIYGMKTKDRLSRVISLSLFGLILVKLFLFDIRGINESGKIIAFVALGILLMVISFLYQRLKKLLVDDESLKQQN